VWFYTIWIPYWATRTEAEKALLQSQAPSDKWRHWFKGMTRYAEEAKKFHEENGGEFDYLPHLVDFKIAYIRYLRARRTAVKIPSVDMSLLSYVPNPLVPWELYADRDPDILSFNQGNEEWWFHDIWRPYWVTRTEEEKASLRLAAPTESWRDWLEWMGDRLDESEKADYAEWDYRPDLEEFKIMYIRYMLQTNKKS
jgi:hypothetical protein